MKKRYFAFSYHGVTDDSKRIAHGDLRVEAEAFPVRSALKEWAAKESEVPAKNIVITNIFEFKSKRDFLSYNENPKI